ncbi:hypothetical protein CPB85DRAFT_1443521 [Mucidula mucida]|nr:hypothetical protein CPB85DRAFT_1443521 [Mucidula mucida]
MQDRSVTRDASDDDSFLDLGPESDYDDDASEEEERVDILPPYNRLGETLDLNQTLIMQAQEISSTECGSTMQDSCESLISNEDVERATAWTDVQELEDQWIEDVWVLVAASYVPRPPIPDNFKGPCGSHADHPPILSGDESSLSDIRKVGYSSSSGLASIFGQTHTANIITCLDIAESVAKLVPVFGDVLEGACGILRKIVNVAEGARAARDECKALTEHTACITLAIINEIGSRASQPAIPYANILNLCADRTIDEVERRITRFSTLGRFKYLTARGRISDEVRDLRARVDNARFAFKIRSDISTAGLLYDLRMMQTRLASRVEDIYMGQQATHHMLHTILVESWSRFEDVARMSMRHAAEGGER